MGCKSKGLFSIQKNKQRPFLTRRGKTIGKKTKTSFFPFKAKLSSSCASGFIFADNSY